MTLAGKVAVVTGAARGIGRACAERFLQDGAKVVISDIDGPALAKTAAEIARREDVRAVEADVTKRGDVERLVPPPPKTSAGWTSCSTTPGSPAGRSSSRSPSRISTT